MKTERFKVQAPTRADLAGGTIDLWPLYCLFKNGKTINVALDLFVTVEFECTPADSFSLVLKGAKKCVLRTPFDGTDEAVASPDLQFPAAIFSLYLRQKNQLPRKRIEVSIQTSAPQGSGLGGSSSLCVALIKGLATLLGDFEKPDWQWDLLQWVKDAEAYFLKLPTGTQDYLAALFGGVNCFDSQIGSISQHAYPPSTFEALSERVLIFYSGDTHHSGLSNWELFRLAMEGNTDILKGLSRIRDTTETLDSFLRANRTDWKEVGKCLTQDWEVRKNLFRVQTPKQDEIVQFLRKQNALGYKVCGAAQGGGLLALINPEEKAKLISEAKKTGLTILSTQCTSKGVSWI